MYIRLSTWSCPACEAPIVKGYGCDKVKCGKCDCLVCYRCGKNISRDKFVHGKDNSCVPVDEPPLVGQWEDSRTP